MAFEFKLPELGENIEQADITKVMVSVGDKVDIDQILLEIETDKATVEVPAEFSGVVKDIKVKDGDTAKVGDVLFTFDEVTDSDDKDDSKDTEESVIEEQNEVKDKEEEKKDAEGTEEKKNPFNPCLRRMRKDFQKNRAQKAVQ